MSAQPQTIFNIYMRKDCVWQYLITGIFCTGLSVFPVSMFTDIADYPRILLVLPSAIVGPLNLYFFWYFSKYPSYQYDQNTGFKIFRAIRKNKIIPTWDINTIRNLNDIRFRLELRTGQNQVIIIDPSLAQKLNQVSGIPLS